MTDSPGWTQGRFAAAEAAWRAENARLRTEVKALRRECDRLRKEGDSDLSVITARGERIKELEAERDRLREALERIIRERGCDWGGNATARDCLEARRPKPCRICQARVALASDMAKESGT